MIHRFTILLPEVSDDVFNKIAGQCPDALSGLASGQACVDFAREADSLGAAIDSAIADLNGVGVSVKGVQVDEMAGVA